MAAEYNQLLLFDPPLEPNAHTPAGQWEADAAKRALDELFSLTFQYRTGKSYKELLDFVSRFQFYSPFNAMLVHLQMPGAVYVAPPYRWLSEWKRTIRPGARPLVILQPMGPVMFVFDVSDTEPQKDAPPLPREVLEPFEVRRGKIGAELKRLIENAIRDGIRSIDVSDGAQSAGSLSIAARGTRDSQRFQNGVDEYRKPVFVDVPVKYDLLVNKNHSPVTKYCTMVHELAHLYCGHLGTPDTRWWPDRRCIGQIVAEFEAESVTYMVCGRLDIEPPSDAYLSSFLKEPKVPAISLDCVMKAAGLIENMSLKPLKMRKNNEL